MPKPRIKWREYQLLEQYKARMRRKKKDYVVVKMLEYEVTLIGAKFWQVYSLN